MQTLSWPGTLEWKRSHSKGKTLWAYWTSGTQSIPYYWYYNWFNYYRPKTIVWECNVFTGICLSMGVGVCGTSNLGTYPPATDIKYGNLNVYGWKAYLILDHFEKSSFVKHIKNLFILIHYREIMGRIAKNCIITWILRLHTHTWKHSTNIPKRNILTHGWKVKMQSEVWSSLNLKSRIQVCIRSNVGCYI